MTKTVFVLRDCFGALVVEPFGAVTVGGFTSRAEAAKHARPGDRILEVADNPLRSGRRKIVPLPPT